MMELKTCKRRNLDKRVVTKFCSEFFPEAPEEFRALMGMFAGRVYYSLRLAEKKRQFIVKRKVKANECRTAAKS